MLDELPRRQPDVIALDSNALWGHMAARLLSLPRVSLMTTFMFDMAQLQQAHITWREWLHMVTPTLAGVPSVLAARSRLIRRFGKAALPPRPGFPARGGVDIDFVPRELQPDTPLVNDTFRFVGPTVNPPTQASDFPFDALPAGPVVYISLGTLHLGSSDFFYQCFEAFADLPAQFILSVGKQTDLQALGTIPSNFIVRQSVPQLDVLKRASVFITHGGMNSALEGLYFGVPLIVIPQQVEQLIIGLNVADRGAGLVLRGALSGRRIAATELSAALERVLHEPGFHEAAKALQESLRESGGYKQAADEIQAFITKGKSA